MLRALRELGLAHGIPTYLCLEEMMACGFGVCLGCAVPVYGAKPYKYCCTDGPVFEARRCAGERRQARAPRRSPQIRSS